MPVEAEEADEAAVAVVQELAEPVEDLAAPVAAREEEAGTSGGRPRRRRLRIRHGEERPSEPREEQDPAT
ncbi:MAG: hypothetical protein FJX53_05865 [Alphaproteobacteria bacterium]|nr:hypothetical protein [Alphaproteobacteria bacterium]